MAVGENVKKIRMLLGITQEDIASELKVKLKAIQKLETKVRISKQVLTVLMSMFNSKMGDSIITIDDFKEYNEQALIGKIKTDSNSNRTINFYGGTYEASFSTTQSLLPDKRRKHITSIS